MKTFPGVKLERSDAASPMTMLRAATLEQHRHLENSLNLMRPGLTKQEYTEILKLFYGFWEPWEQKVAQVLGPKLALFLQNRYRAELLRSDLHHLGIGTSSICRLPQTPFLPSLNTPAEVFGSMYVTEGSTLGGQLLSRHFEDKLGIQSQERSFFYAYGPNTGKMWKEFSWTLATRPSSEYPDMVESAKNTFECLQDWLCGKV